MVVDETLDNLFKLFKIEKMIDHKSSSLRWFLSYSHCEFRKKQIHWKLLLKCKIMVLYILGGLRRLRHTTRTSNNHKSRYCEYNDQYTMALSQSEFFNPHCVGDFYFLLL